MREFGASEVLFERHAEMRYHGPAPQYQSFDLRHSPNAADIRDAFDRDYQRRYGHADSSAPRPSSRRCIVRPSPGCADLICIACRDALRRAASRSRAAGLFRQAWRHGRRRVSTTAPALPAGSQQRGRPSSRNMDRRLWSGRTTALRSAICTKFASIAASEAGSIVMHGRQREQTAAQASIRSRLR